jgi:hypothetical protein
LIPGAGGDPHAVGGSVAITGNRKPSGTELRHVTRMWPLERPFCRHELERRVVYVGSDGVVGRCRRCGKQVRGRGTDG